MVKKGREKMEHILVVEDEKKIARIIELQLSHIGYDVTLVHEGHEAMRVFEENTFDIVLLDVMLPGLDGFEICRRMKAINAELPIIMVSAKDEINDVIDGLDNGADDYVTKPFILDELMARIRSNIRKYKKAQNKPSQDLTFEDLIINIQTYEVHRADEKIELSKTEFDLLHQLVLNKEIVLTREQILNKVWGYDYFGSDNVVDVYIKYLRDKIDKPYERKIIHTVRGRGYVIK